MSTASCMNRTRATVISAYTAVRTLSTFHSDTSGSTVQRYVNARFAHFESTFQEIGSSVLEEQRISKVASRGYLLEVGQLEYDCRYLKNAWYARYWLPRL